MSYAADRTAAVEALGGPDAATPICLILPPGLPGYQPYCPYTVDAGSGTWIATDLGRARHLIAESGTEGARVVVWSHLFDRALANYAVSLLRTLGYRARVHFASDTAFAAVEDRHSRVQATVGEWIADYPSASDFFDPFFRCSADPHAYCRPGLDAAMNRADQFQTTDPTAAARQWARTDRTVTRDAPWVIVAALTQADFVSARCGNYQFNPVFFALLDQLWVR